MRRVQGAVTGEGCTLCVLRRTFCQVALRCRGQWKAKEGATKEDGKAEGEGVSYWGATNLCGSAPWQFL